MFGGVRKAFKISCLVGNVFSTKPFWASIFMAKNQYLSPPTGNKLWTISKHLIFATWLLLVIRLLLVISWLILDVTGLFIIKASMTYLLLHYSISGKVHHIFQMTWHMTSVCWPHLRQYPHAHRPPPSTCSIDTVYAGRIETLWSHSCVIVPTTSLLASLLGCYNLHNHPYYALLNFVQTPDTEN